MRKLLGNLRRLYERVALVAVLNFLAFGGLAAYMIQSGAMTREKGQQMLAILKGDSTVLLPQAVLEKPVKPESGEEPAPATPPRGADLELDVEVMRREAERVKAELDQRLALNNSILLRVQTEREQFERERQEAEKLQQLASAQRQEKGFKKQVSIYGSLAPKTAVQHLLALQEVDQAARILLELDTGKAKRIVEAAKRGDQLDKMRAILARVREVAPDRSQELGSADETAEYRK